MLLLLLQTIESQDDRAFVIDLYDQHYRRLLKEANAVLHNVHDAEDIVQDFFAYLISHIKKFRSIQCNVLERYLVMCIRRKSIDALRNRKAKQKHVVGSIDHDNFAFEYADNSAPFEEAVLNRITIGELKAMFMKLPEQQQHILEYKYLLRMTDREIATVLGIRPNSVRVYLARARNTMNRICKENGYAEE